MYPGGLEIGDEEKKVDKCNYAYQKQCVEARDFEALETYVIELLMFG